LGISPCSSRVQLPEISLDSPDEESELSGGLFVWLADSCEVLKDCLLALALVEAAALVELLSELVVPCVLASLGEFPEARLSGMGVKISFPVLLAWIFLDSWGVAPRLESIV
jgi:hypothetical protein